MSTDEDLARMVESVVTDLEHAVELTSDPASEHAEKWLVSMGVDVDGIMFPSDPEWADESDTDEDAIRDAAEEWLRDVLSIEGIWQGDSRDNASYRGCEVLLTAGGPHIELDTRTDIVSGYWGGSTVERRVDSDVSAFYDRMV